MPLGCLCVCVCVYMFCRSELWIRGCVGERFEDASRVSLIGQFSVFVFVGINGRCIESELLIRGVFFSG